MVVLEMEREGRGGGRVVAGSEPQGMYFGEFMYDWIGLSFESVLFNFFAWQFERKFRVGGIG
jgi:hypothetical protein